MAVRQAAAHHMTARSARLRPRVACATFVTLWLSLGSAAATASEGCHARYREALDVLRESHGEALNGLVRTLRAPDADFDGRWLFARALFEKQKNKAARARVCAETVTSKRGKSRCVRYEMAPAAPDLDEVQIVAPPTAEELKELQALAPVVEARGAAPDAAANGRHGLLIARLSQDLRAYLGQGPHLALCSGGGALSEFYQAQFAPLTKHREELDERARRTWASAIARTRAVAVAELAVYEAAQVEAAKTADAAKSGEVDGAGSAASTSGIGAVMAPPPPIKSFEELAARPLVALILEAARPVLTPSQMTEVASQPSAVASLARTRTAIVAGQKRGTLSAAASVREAVGQALRMLEAAAYAERAKARYAPLDATLLKSIDDIAAAHKRVCTCDD